MIPNFATYMYKRLTNLKYSLEYYNVEIDLLRQVTFVDSATKIQKCYKSFSSLMFTGTNVSLFYMRCKTL